MAGAATTEVATGTHISVIMPAYDEAPNLAEVIPRTVAVLEALGASFEVVVVDDGSTDGTRSLLRRRRDPPHRALRLRRNCGKSTALQAGPPPRHLAVRPLPLLARLPRSAHRQVPDHLHRPALLVAAVQLMSLRLLAELVVHYRRPRSSEVLVE